MPDMAEQVSHLEIYRLLIEVKTTMEMALKQRAEDRKRDDDEKADIFNRLKTLEGSAAKWAGISVACSFFLALLVTAVSPKLHLGQPIVEAQPSGK